MRWYEIVEEKWLADNFDFMGVSMCLNKNNFFRHILGKLSAFHAKYIFWLKTIETISSSSGYAHEHRT